MMQNMRARMGSATAGSYLFLPVLLALTVSAVVNLPLFQDGSSYLVELLNGESAIRHGRLPAFLIQLPSVVTGKLLKQLDAGPDERLRAVRLMFSLSYSLMPFVALALSWLVVRRRNEGLFVWIALIILFVNLVNFSWVSELLMALQLSCPLLLASIVMPNTKAFWLLTAVLLPIIFLLHPLVVPMFLTIAVGSAYLGHTNTTTRKPAFVIALLFLVAGLLRGLFSLRSMTPYEASFLDPQEANDYLFMTSKENMLFLAIALAIGLTCLSTHLISRVRAISGIVLATLVVAQVVALAVLLSNLSFMASASRVVILIIAGAAVIGCQYRYRQRSSTGSDLRSIFLACMVLAAIGGGMLVSQYISGSGRFPLKTGLALFSALLLMLMAYADSTRQFSPLERSQRYRLALVLSFVFAFVILSKSLLWHTSVAKLERSLSLAGRPCTERIADEFTWLNTNPYNIINNWSLPSLTLVVQDAAPRKLLLDQHSCTPFYDSGKVQIDPWSNLSRAAITPPLE